MSREQVYDQFLMHFQPVNLVLVIFLHFFVGLIIPEYDQVEYEQTRDSRVERTADHEFPGNEMHRGDDRRAGDRSPEGQPIGRASCRERVLWQV